MFLRSALLVGGFNGHAPASSGHPHGQLNKYWLPHGCVGWESNWICEKPWKTQKFKGRGLCQTGFQIRLPSEALNVSSIGKTQMSDPKGMASSNNKKGFEVSLEISFYKIVF